jgi:hypothetical protein
MRPSIYLTMVVLLALVAQGQVIKDFIQKERNLQENSTSSSDLPATISDNSISSS